MGETGVRSQDANSAAAARKDATKGTARCAGTVCGEDREVVADGSDGDPRRRGGLEEAGGRPRGDGCASGRGRKGIRFGCLCELAGGAARSRDARDHFCLRRRAWLSGGVAEAGEAKSFV